MDHRFTDPTPVSRGDHHRIGIFVAAWEIECCAPPPVVGSSSTWALEFVSSTRFPLPALDDFHHWQANRWVDKAGRDSSALRLSRGPITACWTVPEAGVSPGSVRLHGHLDGTAHGSGPSAVHAITGEVQRVRVVAENVSGVTLTDVQRSPRWFHMEPHEDRYRPRQIGVLLDLAVRS